MVEGILGTLLAYQVLDVVYYKGVDALVEVYEIIDFTIAYAMAVVYWLSKRRDVM